jgi:hypothetical protein
MVVPSSAARNPIIMIRGFRTPGITQDVEFEVALKKFMAPSVNLHGRF